jgi:hypothetical protein
VQAGTFNRYWLKDGQSLNGVQRVGYGLFSLMFIAFGTLCGTGLWLSWQDGDVVWCLLWAIGTVPLLFFGGLGLINIFRFRKR